MAIFPKTGNVSSIDSNFFVEIFLLNATDVSNKFIELQVEPTETDKVLIDVVSGTTQTAPVDFSITGKIVDWAGRGMETGVIIGTILRVTYVI